MQLVKDSCFLPAVVAVSLLFVGVPGRAQYAFNHVAVPGSVSRNVEEPPKAGAYRMVHGVVQGEAGALPGATVWLWGSRTIAVTNSEGEFELRVPADAKLIKIVCGYGGLQEEALTLAPVQALGSVYLLRTKSVAAEALRTK
ncbi:hypothetical protein [Hymenobacter sp.]|uniref:hypothetical protein n=1 Tax=Hymenobacter sp. TaxID=1898978 RepID=UPI00286C8AE2|nr:hypothetical protein [Hymenobacter sp.]